MNRLLVGLMVALLMVTATRTSANAAPRDFVSGSGKFNFGVGVGHATFTGHGGPRHNNGVIRLKVPGTTFGSVRAKVDCIAVNGNHAAIGGTLRRPTEAGKYVLLYLEDNGKPRARTDRGSGQLSTIPFDCAAAIVGSGSNIVRGNVVVKDKTP